MKIIKLIYIFCILFIANSVYASELAIDITSVREGSGVYIANINLNIGTSTINAIEGSINFDSKKLNVEKIITGKSIIKAWILQPEVNSDNIAFSGIVPGGYTGTEGNIFQVIFSANTKSEAVVSGNLKTFLNDGFATGGLESKFEQKFNTVAIIDKSVLNEIVTDTAPPKILQSVISQNDAMFDGVPFIVVSAKDEESGIAKLEIAIADQKIPESDINLESKLEWVEIQSPAVLPENFDKKYVYTRVIDREGNYVAQLVSLPRQLSPENFINRLKDWWGFGILIVLVFGIFVAIRRFLRRHGTTNSSTIQK